MEFILVFVRLVLGVLAVALFYLGMLGIFVGINRTGHLIGVANMLIGLAIIAALLTTLE